MKSLVKDESLSMLNHSSVFENLLTVYYVISTEWEIYTNLWAQLQTFINTNIYSCKYNNVK